MSAVATEISEIKKVGLADANACAQAMTYFIVAVLGFSFWFFLAVPFASHRETYWWLAMVQTKPFSQAFGIISSTYRPVAQAVTWAAFLLVGPRTFPTSLVRQSLLQGLVYGFFVLAWWLMYSTSPQRKCFAVLACVTGAVFFSGYVHLFHIYGLMYVPVMLMLGTLLHFYGNGTFEKHQKWLAVVAARRAIDLSRLANPLHHLPATDIADPRPEPPDRETIEQLPRCCLPTRFRATSWRTGSGTWTPATWR